MTNPVEFHNTSDLRGEELSQADMTAQKQRDWIKAFYDRNSHQNIGPSDCKRAFDKAHGSQHWNNGTGVLLTSIRRAISNLSKGEGSWLVKLSTQVKTDRGGKEFLWTRRKPAGELFGNLPGKYDRLKDY